MLDIRGFVPIPPRSIGRVEWRVSFRKSEWVRQPKARLFAREHDAFRYAERRRLEGYEVSVEWREVGPWHGSHAESLERHLGPLTAIRLQNEAERAHERRAEKAQRRVNLA
jgi:hypothetical protein